MSVAVAAMESCILSALQPNSSRTAYVVPSDVQLGAKSARVQQQVRQRLAEKRSSSVPRLDRSEPGPTDYEERVGKSFASSQGFSSRSMIHTPSRVMAVPTVPIQSPGFSSYSNVEKSPSRGYRMSQPGTTLVQKNHIHTRNKSKSLCQMNQEELSPSFLVSSESPPHPHPLPIHTQNTMRRSLSGTLARGGGEASWHEEDFGLQPTYRGPSHRTISRITNRQQHHQLTSAWGQEAGSGGRVGPMAGGSLGGQWQHMSRGSGVSGIGQYQVTLNRAASLRSLRSVGKGVDVDGGSTHCNDQLGGMQGLDMVTAVRYLSELDPAMQVMGAAYIQHQCYHRNDAKDEVRSLHGVPALILLFSSENQEVQRFATGAARNLIYENTDNKVALIGAGGLTRIVNILKEPDEELRKNITGILWNLSSRDNLKEKLSREVLSELTERVLVPLCRDSIQLNQSEKDIFCNTTGCLRNLSSVNERTRQKMREMRSLVDSLVFYIQNALQEDRLDNKGVENTVCILRNLSYQLYIEPPLSAQRYLASPSSDDREDQLIGCFPMQSKKSKEKHNQELSMFAKASHQPHGAEWLCHPQLVALYKAMLQNSHTSAVTREASIGALQNITVGEARWTSVLSFVILEQERMLPIILELLDTNSDMELRPLTGLLRNLARHSYNKEHMAKIVVQVLVAKLPSDGMQKEPSSEVVINICGALNYLVSSSSLAARDICYFNGIPKLVGIKTSHDNSYGALKAAKAASTVLCNMFQYNKLHKDYKQKGFSRRDLTDSCI